MRLRGQFRLLFLYDVAESIDLDKLRSLLGARVGAAEHSFPRRTPDYVRFEQPPIVEPPESVTVCPGLDAACPAKYYSFGALVIQVQVPFECGWDELVREGSRWMDAPGVEPIVREVARKRLEQIRPAVNKPNDDWLQENYLVVEIHEARAETTDEAETRPKGAAQAAAERTVSDPSADELMATHGPELVQLIRGEIAPLARKAMEETLQSSLSYYPSDLAMIGPHGAVVYDGPEDSAAVTQILEYAKMQLLEFRYYDRLMSHVLADFYTSLEQKRNALLARWTLPRDAQRFNTIRLDVMELTERIDNAIKFVSDIYYARIYRVAAKRMGVEDYRTLVDEKLHTFGELYDSMIDRYNETRSFVLEVLVTILAILDVILLFKGR